MIRSFDLFARCISRCASIEKREMVRSPTSNVFIRKTIYCLKIKNFKTFEVGEQNPAYRLRLFYETIRNPKTPAIMMPMAMY
jgi:hypothetical protein